MANFKKITLCSLSVLLLSACSSTPPTSFDELDQVLEPTETTMEQRTVAWYVDQQLIRTQVMSTCFDHLSAKAEKMGGEYQVEFNNDVFSKFSEYPDCENAKVANIKSMTNVSQVYEHQIAKTESQLNTPENQAHINNVAADVARKLDNLDQNNETINSDGMKALSDLEQNPKIEKPE